jgi:hypothetical protein
MTLREFRNNNIFASLYLCFYLFTRWPRVGMLFKLTAFSSTLFFAQEALSQKPISKGNNTPKTFYQNDSLSYTYRPLTVRDSATYRMIDSIEHVQDLIRNSKITEVIATGNIPLGPMNLDYKKLIGYNNYEGLRLGLGLSTNQKIGSFYSLGGHFSYGFKDKNW